VAVHGTNRSVPLASAIIFKSWAPHIAFLHLHGHKLRGLCARSASIQKILNIPLSLPEDQTRSALAFFRVFEVAGLFIIMIIIFSDFLILASRNWNLLLTCVSIDPASNLNPRRVLSPVESCV
jgi:hypothetical protein